MLAAVHAFSLIASVMAAGGIVGRSGALGENARIVLNRTAFHVGIPAVVLLVLAP